MVGTQDETKVTREKPAKQERFWFRNLRKTITHNLKETNSFGAEDFTDPPGIEMFMDEDHGKIVLRRVYAKTDLVKYNTVRVDFIHAPLMLNHEWKWETDEITQAHVRHVVQAGDVTLYELGCVEDFDTAKKVQYLDLLTLLADKLPMITISCSMSSRPFSTTTTTKTTTKTTKTLINKFLLLFVLFFLVSCCFLFIRSFCFKTFMVSCQD